MRARKLSDQLSVGPHISVKDVKALKAQGYKSIVCNLPDGELRDQAIFSQIRKAAKKEGLEAHYLPIKHGPTQASNVEAFKQHLDTLPGPIFAYCRTGMRSSSLYKTVNRGNGGGFFKRLFG